MGNLTQNDLGHGFLFRRKDNPEVIGRLSLGEYDYINHIEFMYEGEWDEIKFNPLKWEGITITNDSLISNLKWGWNAANTIVLKSYEMWTLIFEDTCISMRHQYHSSLTKLPHITHVHDLQRLVLALTGKPLEGGPK